MTYAKFATRWHHIRGPLMLPSKVITLLINFAIYIYIYENLQVYKDQPGYVYILKYNQGHGVERHYQQYFSYIVMVSFIGGGNSNSQRWVYVNPATKRSQPRWPQKYYIVNSTSIGSYVQNKYSERLAVTCDRSGYFLHETRYK